MRTESWIRAVVAVITVVFLAPSIPAAEVTFDPVLTSHWYKDGNVQVVSEGSEPISDEAISLSLRLPVVVSAPLWSFRAAYEPSRRVYQTTEDASFTSHSLSLAYAREVSGRNTFTASASGYRTQDQRIEPSAPDQPITYLPRTTRTTWGINLDGSSQLTPRSDLVWEVGGSLYSYDGNDELTLEDSKAARAGVGWSHRFTEQSSGGVVYRYGQAMYDSRPDARSHTVAYSGSTETRRRVSLNYRIGLIAADVGDGSGLYTNGGLDFTVGWSPRPDHALSAGARQDVSAGRGLGGPTLDRGVYVGWSWSHIRGVGLAVNGGWWHREGIAGGDATETLYVSESLSWGFNRYLRAGLFHAYRDQTDDRQSPTGPTFDTAYHSGGVTLTWTILGERERRR